MCWTRNEFRVSTNAVHRRNMLLHTARVKRFGGHANPRLARQNLDLNRTHTADVYSPLHDRRWPITLSLLKIRVRTSFVLLPTARRGQLERSCIRATEHESQGANISISTQPSFILNKPAKLSVKTLIRDRTDHFSNNVADCGGLRKFSPGYYTYLHFPIQFHFLATVERLLSSCFSPETRNFDLLTLTFESHLLSYWTSMLNT